jgi:hypothetical protein
MNLVSLFLGAHKHSPIGLGQAFDLSPLPKVYPERGRRTGQASPQPHALFPNPIRGCAPVGSFVYSCVVNSLSCAKARDRTGLSHTCCGVSPQPQPCPERCVGHRCENQPLYFEPIEEWKPIRRLVRRSMKQGTDHMNPGRLIYFGYRLCLLWRS